MLIGLSLFFWFLEPYLNAAAMFAKLKQLGKFDDLIALLNRR